MPTKEDRRAFQKAFNDKNQDEIRALLQRDDAKELLLMKDDYGYLVIHDACCIHLEKPSLQLILDAAVEHGIAKEMFEEKNENGRTCLHLACDSNMLPDPFCLLLDYLSKHADIKKLLEEKTNDDQTCLHLAYRKNLTADSIGLLLEYLAKYADITKVLEKKDNYGSTCLQWVCGYLSADTLRLLLEYLSKHSDIKRMLEDKDKYGRTCLHMACQHNSSADSPLRLLLEYLSNHADLQSMLTEKDNNGFTCLHLACLNPLSVESLRLLISFFTSKDLFTRVLDARDSKNKKAIDYAKNKETKQLLRDPDCFEKCRVWLFVNFEDTFLYSLFPNSLDKTCQALKELAKNGLQETPERSTIMLIAFMSSPSKFREAVNKTHSSAPMARYFDVVKKGDKKSDYNHWRKNIHLFRDFFGQFPPSERRRASAYESEGEGRCSCSIQ